jgi:hypothetical protein
MEPSPDHLQQEIDSNGKAVVDNKEATTSGVSGTAKRPIRGLDWTSILSRSNLESPGYRETIEKMKADGRLKNQL